jgi:hypothetical protein
MARLITSGGEIRDHPTASIGGPDGYSGGAAATTTELTTFRSGQASIKCPGTSANTAYRIFPFTAPTAGTSLFARVYFRVSALPNATKVIAKFSAGATNLVGVKLTSAGLLQLFNLVAGTQIGSDSVDVIAVDRWYRLELKQTIGTGSTDATELRLATDEALPPDYASTLVASSSAVSISDTQPTEFRAGWVEAPGVTSSMFLDDVAVNDSTGTKQTAHAGEGRVAVLKPLRDLDAQGWTPQSATVLRAQIDNLPPIGPTEQILNSLGTMPQEYSFRLETYGSAGVSGNLLKVLAFGSGAEAFGRVSAGERLGERIQTNGTIDYLELSLARVGSPTDDVVVEIQTNSSDFPSGTVLASATIVGSSLPTSAGSWIRVDLDSHPALGPYTPYWLTVRRTGSMSDTDYYLWSVSEAYWPHVSSFGANYVGGGWIANNSEYFAFKVFVSSGFSPIPVIQPVVCHAETVSTGSKTGACELTSNPVIVSSTFTYGDNVGAVSAYPGNWRWHRGNINYDADISNVALAPEAIVEKTDTGTREAAVCFFGVVVEYVPPFPKAG